jgi:hypothetical protein
MLKTLLATTAAIALFGALPVQAQQTQTQTQGKGNMESVKGSMDSFKATDLGALNDARIELVKSALRLTPDQEKLWPTVESTIRSNGQDREARLQKAADRLEQIKGEGVAEALKNRNPIEFLNRRADALAQRSADARKLATAWQPLYQTLTPDQKRRLALLTIYAVREMRDNVADRHFELMDQDADE